MGGYDSALTYQARARGYNALGYGEWRESAVIEPLTLTASAVTATTATLTLANHTGDWWLKKTAPTPAGTCTAGEADFSHALSSLTAGTAYTYRAYRDSGCATEIASATFTTLSLTADDVTTTATLTIANHTGNWYVKQTAPTARVFSKS